MTYKQVLENKIQGMRKKALLGKGKLFSFITDMLKSTTSYNDRKGLIQGLRGLAGEHPTTVLGRYVLQKVTNKTRKMPSTALFKKELQNFLVRQKPERKLDWNLWQGLDSFPTAVKTPREAMSKLLQRLSRRTMWTDRQQIRPYMEAFRSHLNARGQAQRAKWPNYNPDEYAKAQLAHYDFKWW